MQAVVTDARQPDSQIIGIDDFPDHPHESYKLSALQSSGRDRGGSAANAQRTPPLPPPQDRPAAAV